MKTVIEMAREAGLHRQQHNLMSNPVQHRFSYDGYEENLERFAELVRADERKEIAEKTGEFAKKWWKIHCDSNLHYSSTLKAHQDFCALQAAIRTRSNA